MNNSNQKPKAYLIHGFVGAGKTTFAKKLEKETGAIRFTLDEWMIRLFGNNPPVEKFNDYYNKTKNLLRETALTCLEKEMDIILDEGFWKRKERDKTRKLIEDRGGEPIIYYVKASEQEMRKRTLERTKNPPEDAFVINDEAFEKFKSRFEPLERDEQHIVV